MKGIPFVETGRTRNVGVDIKSLPIYRRERQTTGGGVGFVDGYMKADDCPPVQTDTEGASFLGGGRE